MHDDSSERPSHSVHLIGVSVIQITMLVMAAAADHDFDTIPHKREIFTCVPCATSVSP
jgi:hypothetical protein